MLAGTSPVKAMKEAADPKRRKSPTSARMVTAERVSMPRKQRRRVTREQAPGWAAWHDLRLDGGELGVARPLGGEEMVEGGLVAAGSANT